MNQHMRAVQERRRSNAAGPHRLTRQTRAAMLAQAFDEDPIEWARMRRQITAIEEADQDDENRCDHCGRPLRTCCYTCPSGPHEDMCGF